MSAFIRGSMKSFSILAIKILALYLVLTTLYSFLPVVFSGNINSILTPKLLVILSATIILPIIGGVILWNKAVFIANKIHKGEASLTKASDNEIVSAGLFLVGITLLIRHTGIFINHFLSMNQINYGSIFIIAVSLLLVFQSRIFKNLYLKYNNT